MRWLTRDEGPSNGQRKDNYGEIGVVVSLVVRPRLVGDFTDRVPTCIDHYQRDVGSATPADATVASPNAEMVRCKWVG